MKKANLLQLIGRYFNRAATPYWIILILDCLIVLFSGLLAYSMWNGFHHMIDNFGTVMVAMAISLAAYGIGFKLMRTYSGIIRYSSFIDLARIAVANVGGLAIILLLRLIPPVKTLLSPLAPMVLVLNTIIATLIIWWVRISIKFIYEKYFVRTSGQKIVIYGVKEGGVAIAKGINSSDTDSVVGGFVTDDKTDCSHLLMGQKILFNDDTLTDKLVKMNVKVLAVSPMKLEAFRNNSKMIDALANAGIKIKIFSPLEWDGKSEISDTHLKDVKIEDLLPRNKIEIDMEAIGEQLRGTCVMITGAAGSIGSEIARKVASFKPANLVLVDQAETPLHDIRMMMARKFADIKCQTITASICQKFHMERIFETYKPDYLFHAAAYKHVPMMEDDPAEAVMNNIEGTRIIADLAVRSGVKKFVMVSTDKAVNPTNVMGCSKRICEMYCQSLDMAIKEGQVEGATEFVTTRFGNVLGSNGSVIPIFREQIKAGGPVTVTHPDIIRYFMLIPEACSLVLQAGTMGHGGEIFVFDMGNPVKIADLAQRMIQLSGATNVKIEYTGLRDGEKLYEELLNEGENTKPTSHPKIKLATVRKFGYETVNRGIEKLVEATRSKADDMTIVALMKAMVPEFISRHSKYEILDGGGEIDPKSLNFNYHEMLRTIQEDFQERAGVDRLLPI